MAEEPPDERADEPRDERSYGRVFDDVAAEYDRRRPSYPEELIDRACAVAGLRSGDPVLELGSGTGKLTRRLAARGLHVTAIEPGARLISVAAQHPSDAGNVQFVNARFEDAQLADAAYRAAFCATAFHWIDPDVSWEKVARALTPGGTLALIQHCGVEEERTREDDAALLAAIMRIAPEIARDWPPLRDLETILAGVQERRTNVSEVWAWIGRHEVARAEAGRLFEDVRIEAVPVRIEQTAEELGAYLRTTSLSRRLGPVQLHALEDENAAIYERLGRPIRSSLAAVLVTARAQPRPPAHTRTT
jgi:ubiquinone/menaquinone biosynthesis C-methylase UbiE